MPLSDLLAPETVLVNVKAVTKKQVLQDLAERAAQKTQLDSRLIYDLLLQRERLGTTGIGDGVAIPHGRIPGLKTLTGIAARLEKPLDFDSIDGQPVSFVFLLLAPENAGADHLKALARVARFLRQGSSLERIKAARDDAALYAILSETTASQAA